MAQVTKSRAISKLRRFLPICGVFCVALISGSVNGRDDAENADVYKEIQPKVSTHSASNFLLKLATYELAIGGTSGGGIAGVDDTHIIVSGNGDFFVYRHVTSSIGPSSLKSLPYRAPMNTAGFLAAAEAYSGNPRSVNTGWFRVNDVLTANVSGRTRVVVSHDYWNQDDACLTVRLSYVDILSQAFIDGSAPAEWRLLYETSPCVSFKATGHPFAGMQAGGKMTMLSGKDDKLLVAFGDLEFDGVNSDIVYSQDTTSSYGKVVSIDLATGQSEQLTLGHRSPSGLYSDKSGRVWLTEHGPQGGDELNLIVKGANYGWPLVTYGTQYETYSWPLSAQQSEHNGFEAPIYSWVPSIGISDVIRIEGNGFPVWQGDLLVASLRAGSLFRVRARGGKTHLVEPIPVGVRIRDFVETDNGELLLWTDSGSIIAIEPIDDFEEIRKLAGSSISTWSGQSLFRACTACHTSRLGEPHGIGPNLWNIVAKDIASYPDYLYSPSLSAISGVWDAAMLDAFLADPQAFAPGNRMMFQGLSNAIDRRNLIEFMKDEMSEKMDAISEDVEIEYISDSAGTVYLVWGIDGWQPLPPDALPPMTEIWDDGIMHTSMTQTGNIFRARIRAPERSELEFGFLITSRKDRSKTSVWDGDYRLDRPIERIVTIDGLTID